MIIIIYNFELNTINFWVEFTPKKKALIHFYIFFKKK